MKVRELATHLMDRLCVIVGVPILTAIIRQVLTAENIVDFVDGILDFLSQMAAATETELDDKILRAIRDALDLKGEKADKLKVLSKEQ